MHGGLISCTHQQHGRYDKMDEFTDRALFRVGCALIPIRAQGADPGTPYRGRKSRRSDRAGIEIRGPLTGSFLCERGDIGFLKAALGEGAGEFGNIEKSFDLADENFDRVIFTSLTQASSGAEEVPRRRGVPADPRHYSG